MYKWSSILLGVTFIMSWKWGVPLFILVEVGSQIQVLCTSSLGSNSHIIKGRYQRNMCLFACWPEEGGGAIGRNPRVRGPIGVSSDPLPCGAPSSRGKIGPPMIWCFQLSLVIWCRIKFLSWVLQFLCIPYVSHLEETQLSSKGKKCLWVCFMASLGFGVVGPNRWVERHRPSVGWP